MINIISILIPLFSLIIIGFVAGKTGIAKQSWTTVLNLFGFYITFPALVFKSLAFTQLSFWYNSSLIMLHIVIGVVVILVLVGITRLFKMKLADQNTIAIASYFSMSGYIGIPALQLVLGDQAAAEGAITVAVMLIVTLTLGVGLLEASRTKHVHVNTMLWAIVKNPLIWAAALGITVGSLHFELPTVIQQIIIMLAQAASPTVLVSLGIFLAYTHIHAPALRLACLITSIKMVVLPGLCLLVMWLMPQYVPLLKITFIQLAMPTAITTFALAEVYPMNKEVVSSSIMVGTLAAFVIIPLAMWLTTTF